MSDTAQKPTKVCQGQGRSNTVLPGGLSCLMSELPLQRVEALTGAFLSPRPPSPGL